MPATYHLSHVRALESIAGGDLPHAASSFIAGGDLPYALSSLIEPTMRGRSRDRRATGRSGA
jgi:hypothetical protein